MTTVIKPKHAASLWAVGNTLYVELPGTGEKAHTLALPNNAEGITKLLSLLKARTPSSKLGTPGDPTQWQIDKAKVPEYDLSMVHRVAKPTFTPAQLSTATAVLQKMGLI